MKLKNQPEFDDDVTFGQQVQKLIVSVSEFEFFSILTESDVIAKFGLIFELSYTINVLAQVGLPKFDPIS